MKLKRGIWQLPLPTQNARFIEVQSVGSNVGFFHFLINLRMIFVSDCADWGNIVLKTPRGRKDIVFYDIPNAEGEAEKLQEHLESLKVYNVNQV